MPDNSFAQADVLLKLENLHFAYPSGQSVLNGVNLELLPTQSIGLSGPNGSGKTTLFRCITGLETPQAGAIWLNGQEIKTEKDFRNLRKRVGFSLQNAEDQLFFPTVLEDVSFGPLNLGLSQEEAKERSLNTLAMLGLYNFEKRLTFELSGGQQKLVALAAVLAMRPNVLLLDEPLNGLDKTAAQRLQTVLGQLQCAKIIVSHDGDLLTSLCARLVQLENGQII